MQRESEGWTSRQNRVSKLWRFITGFFSVLLLLGCVKYLTLKRPTSNISSYLLLPVVFGRPDERTRIDHTASAVFALFFLGVSYAGSIVIAFFQRERKIFLLRSLFM